ncbi:phosphoribosyl-dephospho-CoA transferase [Plasticicumulans lactativorans]|uniref:Phosphoribosyl-dephospho-CoA transferase n=1 Tax=Plasticicumulans lactativorans TaxID=1133106 RepID=A0A4R2LEK6_9GAMM|nr:malonate decarboxylase holo-[acyl-carrier-protein] synthase [Plasticicumulans lactativorans]TCO83023.1 phosphoribosyl-dephospho-CoA transferase [Plasticicumulans lactativorans]
MRVPFQTAGTGERHSCAPRRHDSVWLHPDWAAHLASPLDAAAQAAVAGWCAAGRPLVTARRQPGDAAATLRLGLALPTCDGRRRIGLHLDTAAVARVAPPPPLAAALVAAPPAWREALAALAAAAAGLGVDCRVYGSLAWQFLSGAEYLRPASDVDLLLAADVWPALERLLGRLAETTVPRLDGEVLLPDGDAVAWRELAARPARVLVKGPDRVGFRSHAGVIAAFGGA